MCHVSIYLSIPVAYSISLHVYSFLQSKTPLHIDKAGAFNWAVAIEGTGAAVDVAKPLARWWFVNPKDYTAVLDYIVSKRWAVRDTRTPLLTEDQWKEVKDHVGSDAVVLVLQHHNEYIRVLPGWAHQVDTLQPCIKVAWELINLDHIVEYLRIPRMLSINNVCKWETADYVGIQCIIMSALHELVAEGKKGRALILQQRKAKRMDQPSKQKKMKSG